MKKVMMAFWVGILVVLVSVVAVLYSRAVFIDFSVRIYTGTYQRFKHGWGTTMAAILERIWRGQGTVRDADAV